jgi:hypothetical protein
LAQELKKKDKFSLTELGKASNLLQRTISKKKEAIMAVFAVVAGVGGVVKPVSTTDNVLSSYFVCDLILYRL